MKTTYSFILLLMFVFSHLNAQENKPYRFYFTLGVKPAKVEASQIYISYVDESPSRDNLETIIDLKNTRQSPSLEFGLDYEFPSQFFLRGGLDVHFGQFNGGGWNVGLGYSIVKPKFIFRPLLLFTSGSNGIKLGDIYQNDEYIRVNNTDFYSNSVKLKLSGGYFQANPKAEFAFLMNENLEIRFNVGYNLTLSQRTQYLNFSGSNETGESISAKESISANNVYLVIDNERITKRYTNLNGIHSQIGIAFNF